MILPTVTMKMPVTRLLRVLQAATECVSKDDSRYTLQRVLFEPAKKATRIVSTDGHRLLSIAGPVEQVQATKKIAVEVSLISRIIAWLKLEKRSGVAECSLEIASDGTRVIATFTDLATQNSMSMKGAAGFGEFPEWHRAVPAVRRGATETVLNPVLLMGLPKATKLLGVRSVHWVMAPVEQTPKHSQVEAPSGAVTVSGHSTDFEGWHVSFIVMPMRPERSTTENEALP